MKLSVSHFVEAYEQANGKRPDESSLRFIEHIDKVGQQFRAKGQKDAALDRVPRTEKSFKESAIKYCGNDPEWAQIVADVAYGYYTEGYEGGAA